MAIGIVYSWTCSRGKRFGRPCRIRHGVGLQQRWAYGEQPNSSAFTAAHRTLPFGTMVQVINTNNGRIITVCINDRGPFTRGRVIDLTRAEANQLGFTDLAPVALTVIPVLIDPGLPVRIRCCKGRARITP